MAVLDMRFDAEFLCCATYIGLNGISACDRVILLPGIEGKPEGEEVRVRPNTWVLEEISCASNVVTSLEDCVAE